MNFRALFLFVFLLVVAAAAFPSEGNRLRRDVAEDAKTAAADAKKAAAKVADDAAAAIKPTEKSTSRK
ncbi:unnamed protein product [Parnassius apollo]|uniref:(apollo) hypothetical protein n=1 Tax=Parnassius apollo TaxID=110799 RepID=A0A8S3Y3U2_PARAO|nr:unnamed protein product [Parnassius apollo]